jgi:hypothetical protein
LIDPHSAGDMIGSVIEAKLREFEQLYRKAAECRVCFKETRRDEVPTIDRAQPRWIGRRYGRSKPKTLVLLVNPGSGAVRSDTEDRRAIDLISRYRRTKGSISSFKRILDHFEKDSRNWKGGAFRPFYSKDIGLDFDNLAFANVAWCSTTTNSYPSRMLNECFKRHTSQLLRILSPDRVLLSGGAIKRFAPLIRQILPAVQVIEMPHYRWRKGTRAWTLESARIRRKLLQR